MNGQERTYRAIKLEKPDRVPMDNNLLLSAYLSYKEKIHDIIKIYPNDVSTILSSQEKHDLDITYHDGYVKDSWGVTWYNPNGYGYKGIPQGHPIDEWSKLGSYRVPFKEIKDSFRNMSENIKNTRSKFIKGGWIRLFERMHFLRGFENLLLDLGYQDDRVIKLRDMVMEYNLSLLKEYLKYDIDLVCFSDDWGTQTSLMISPGSWRNIFKPCYDEMVSIVHDHGKLTCLHSDGMISSIMDDIVEIGFDVVNLQIHLFDFNQLRDNYAEKVCFWGRLDFQKLHRISPEEASNEVKFLISNLGKAQGGYIGEVGCGDEVSLTTIEAIFKAYSNHGIIHQDIE
ncbi:MAG: hypothetical protein APF76_09645 [Desulfitibacter sp. BRH_c19]|nr:MAG: hypothetical protein APF76_09645 [Desulfitibacter sp. BRH_c19]